MHCINEHLELIAPYAMAGFVYLDPFPLLPELHSHTCNVIPDDSTASWIGGNEKCRDSNLWNGIVSTAKSRGARIEIE